MFNRIGLTVLALGASAGASAALPLEVETAFTGLSADLGTLQGYILTAVVAVAVLFKVISMIKRGIGKV